NGKADTLQPISMGQGAGTYTNVIVSLLAIRDSAAQLAGDPTLSFQMRAAGAIAQEKEFSSREREVGLEALIDRKMSPVLFQDFTTALTGQNLQDAAFGVVASQAEQTVYRQIVTGDALRPSQDARNIFLNAGQFGAVGGLTVDQWDATSSTRSQVYR